MPAKVKAKDAKKFEDTCHFCRESYERWDHIKQFGAGDPCWEDGVNINLVRNHIIYAKREMQRLSAECGFVIPDEVSFPWFYKELPPEMPDVWMANDRKPFRIREREERERRAAEEEKAKSRIAAAVIPPPIRAWSQLSMFD